MLAHSSNYPLRLKISLLALTFLSGCATDHPVKAFVVSETYTSFSPSHHELPNAETSATRVFSALAGLSTAKTADSVRLKTLTQIKWHSAAMKFSGALTKKDYAVVYVSAHGAVNGAGDIELLDSMGHPFKVTEDFQDVMTQAFATVFFLDICRKTDDAISPSNLTGVKLVGSNGLILFSTDLGRNAGDALIFSEQVAQEISRRQELRVTLRNIIKNVGDKTSRTSKPELGQHPWTYGLIPSDIYLAGPPRKPGTGP